MDLVIHSERILISSESFPPSKKDILDLQIEERIRPLGPWTEDIDLSHCVHLQEKGGSRNSYIIISLPGQDIQKSLTPLTGSGIRVKRCIPHVAAIAALSGRLTDEPVISCFLAGGYLEIIASEKGIPYYSQISPQDNEEVPDFEMIAQAIFNVRQIMDSRFNKSVKKLLFFSRNRIALPEFIGQDKIWFPELDHLILKGQKDLVWQYPELAGAPFVNEDFNCLPSNLKSACFVQDINRSAAAFAAAGTLVLAVAGAFLDQDHARALAGYEKIYAQVKAQKEAIVPRIPNPEETANFSTLLKVWEHIATEPSIDSVLYIIARQLPENVVIRKLDAKRTGKVKAGPPEAGQGLPPPEKFISGEAAPTSREPDHQAFYERPLLLNLQLFTTGSFQEVKTRLQKSVSMLGSRFDLGNIRWEYREETGQGLLICSIFIKTLEG